MKRKIQITLPIELANKLETYANGKPLEQVLEEAINLFEKVAENKARGFKVIAKGPFKIERPLN